MRVDGAGRDPQPAFAIEVHVNRIGDQRVRGEQRDSQTVSHGEFCTLLFRIERCEAQFNRIGFFNRRGQGFVVQECINAVFCLLDERVELRDLFGVLTLFMLTEASEVRFVLRSVTVKVQPVLFSNHRTQFVELFVSQSGSGWRFFHA